MKVRHVDESELPRERPEGPPPRWLLLAEARVVWEILLVVLAWPFLARRGAALRRPRVGGLMRSTAEMRTWLP